jgi:predicted RND superfamily exporter protein
VIRPLTHPEASEEDELAGFDSAEDAEALGDASEDGEVEFVSYDQTDELSLAIHSILGSFDFRGAEIHAVGLPVLNLEVQTATGIDMARFSGLSILVIAGLLGFVFRRAVAIALPLLIVVFSVLVALGLMAFFGRPMTMASQIVPSFILAVGVGFAVHLLAIYFQLTDRGAASHDAISQALRHAGPAIIMSALTTAFGMFSFLPSGLLPIRDIGIFVPLGVLRARGRDSSGPWSDRRAVRAFNVTRLLSLVEPVQSQATRLRRFSSA